MTGYAHFQMFPLVEKLQTAFPRGSRAHNILSLMTGTTLAQIVLVGSSPILTRIYSPVELGAQALILTASVIISTIAAGRYELAIILPEKKTDSINIVALCLLLIAATSLVTTVVVLWFGNGITALLGNTEIQGWLLLIPAQVALLSLFQACTLWSNRQKQYKRLGLSRFVKALAVALFSISFGLAGWGLPGLLLGILAGEALGTLALFVILLREERESLEWVSWARMKRQAALHARFPRYLTVSHLIGVVHQYMPLLLISRFFDSATVGHYAIANQFVALPGVLIAQAIGAVFRQEAAEQFRRDGRFDVIFRKTVQKTFWAALPIYGLLVVLAPDIFALALGEPWRTAGEYAAVIAVAGFFSFVITPIDKGAVIVGATRYIFLWHCLLLASYLAIGLALTQFELTIINFLWLVVFARISLYLFDYFMELRFAKGARPMNDLDSVRLTSSTEQR